MFLIAYKMARKLPKPIPIDELNLLIDAAIKQREGYRGKRNKKLKTRGRRINAYLISIFLGAHAGMRISEVVGLRPEGSKCCREPVTEEFSKNEKGNKVKLKVCSKCGKRFSSGDILRLNKGWDIEPLIKENVHKDRIFIAQGKGEKDRWTWRPKKINAEAVSYLPLKVSRRSIQQYFEDLGSSVLNKKIHFHQLRHTFATEYLKKNPEDIKTLQVLMGHSRIDTTAIYLHVSIDDALKKVEDVF